MIIFQDQHTRSIPLHRAVRQGDVIAPRLFPSTMEDLFKILRWKRCGININGVNISHLRFTDGITIIAEALQDQQQMVNDLAYSSVCIGIWMNLDITKVMFNKRVLQLPVTIHGAVFEVIQKYVHLRQILQLRRNNYEDQVNKTIQLGWAAFEKLRTGLIIINQCVLPVMTCGAKLGYLRHDPSTSS